MIDIFQLSTIHFSILVLFLQHHTYTFTHMYRCTYTIRIFSCMHAFICICIAYTLAYKNTHTHITLFCHVVVFFIVFFIEMTILYTMIIVNSHLLHHFIPEPMIQELHTWFDFYVFYFGWDDLSICLLEFGLRLQTLYTHHI